jgi:hypothetical protein
MTELDVIKQKIRQKMNEIADDMALGGAKDYAQYTHMTGIIAGLALVERDIIDYQEMVRDND